jgi:hypothetical protein
MTNNSPIVSVWEHYGDFEVPLQQFNYDFRVLIADIVSAYKIQQQHDNVHIEVRPYRDFVKWAKDQEPDWDRYTWNGTRVLVAQKRLPKSALDEYDNPNLAHAGISTIEWYNLGFADYITTLAKAIQKSANIPPLVAVNGFPIDGRHRTLAALQLGLKVAPVMNLIG